MNRLDLIVIGAGSAGISAAHAARRSGAEVAIVESDRLGGDCPNYACNPTEDPEIRVYLRRLLETQGVTVYEWAKVTGAGRDGNNKWVTLTMDGREERVVAAEILVATGRAPAVDLALEVPGVEVSEHGVVTDTSLQTSHPDFWAAGDVAGKMLFTHVAAYEGYVAGTNAAGGRPQVREDLQVVPRVTFAEPEIASVGLTEAEARESGYEVTLRRHEFATQSRALMMGEVSGFVKIVLDGRNEEILGGHIIGPRAGEMIHEIAVAMKNGLRFSHISETIHAYPTLAEAVGAAETVQPSPAAAVEKGVAEGSSPDC